MSEQIEKIAKLIKSATNSKQKAMYQDLLAKLQAELDVQPEANSKPQPPAPPQPLSKPRLKPKPQPTAESSQEFATQPSPVKPQPLEPAQIASVAQSLPEAPTPEPEQIERETQLEPHNSDNSEPNSDEAQAKACFQAVGMINGQVTLKEEQSIVQLYGYEYPLFYIPNKRRYAYEALKKEIEATGNTTHRLIVYPKILHFPKKDQPHQVAFQLVGFVGSQASASSLNSELEDGEFKLCGLWQFIPVCRFPCISVFRNFDQERLNWIKQAEAPQKVKFMKASHLPLLWRDSPVKPFRFNPRLEKEQQAQTYFVQVKARFVPERNVFEFISQLSEPVEEAPGFLKASKKLKAEALKALSSK